MPLLSCPPPCPHKTIAWRGHQLDSLVFENTSRWKFIAAFIRPLHFYHLQAAFHASAATASLFPAHIQRVRSNSEQCQCQRDQPSVKQCKSGDINVYFGLAAHICIIPSHLRCSTTWKMLGASNKKKSKDPSSHQMAVLCSPSNCQWCRCTAIDAPCSTFSYEAFDKECGETDVPVKVVKGLFSHSGDVALNEYFILTFFNTIAGLSLTHCYLSGVEFTKWDKLGISNDCLLVIGHKMSDDGRLFERTNLTWEVFWVNQGPEQHLILYHPKCPFGFKTSTRRSIDHQ